MYTLYAFRDKKSGVLSNHFVTAEPFSKVQQNISISLLQLSLKEPSNPFVLFSKDYDLVAVQSFADDMELSDNTACVNCDVLLTASRRAYTEAHNHTSLSDELDKHEE